jgi:hypothetical protein
VARVALVIAGVLALSATPAAATWSAAGTGAGAARAITLPSPTGATATCTAGSGVRLDWAASALATSYVVQRKRTTDLDYSDIGTTTGTTLTDDDPALLGLVTTWRVVAVRSAWRSAPSAASSPRTVTSLGICL